MKRLIAPILAFVLCAMMLYAVSHADDDKINACYKKKQGQLRIVENGSPCLPSEVPISWSKAAPVSPLGVAGPAGPQGPQGEPGPAGTSVSITLLQEGDPNCPNGGTMFTAADGVAYACNGGNTRGSTITTRRLVSSPCSSDGSGWCPNSYLYYFRIRDSVVSERSVIFINVFDPDETVYRGCEVSSKAAGEFQIICTGSWFYIQPEAMLDYVVVNP